MTNNDLKEDLLPVLFDIYNKANDSNIKTTSQHLKNDLINNGWGKILNKSLIKEHVSSINSVNVKQLKNICADIFIKFSKDLANSRYNNIVIA